MSRLRILALGLACVISAPAVALSHGGHGSDLPIQACESSDLGEVCSFENDHHDIFRGTCRSMGGGLRCVRNQPVEHAGSSAPAPSKPWPVAPALAVGVLAAAAAIALRKRMTASP